MLKFRTFHRSRVEEGRGRLWRIRRNTPAGYVEIHLYCWRCEPHNSRSVTPGNKSGVCHNINITMDLEKKQGKQHFSLKTMTQQVQAEKDLAGALLLVSI